MPPLERTVSRPSGRSARLPRGDDSRAPSGTGRRFSLVPSLPILLLLLLSISILSAPAAGADEGGAEEAVALFERSVSKAASLCRGILRDIRRARDAHPPGALSPEAREAARGSLARTAGWVRLFRTAVEEAERARERALAAIGEGEGAGGGEERRVREASSRLDIYRQYVNRFWKEAVDRYGEPPAPEIPYPETGSIGDAAGRPVRVSGEIRAGLGSSSYERPNATPDPEDESGTLFEGYLRADGALPNGTELRAVLGRESRVIRREITLSRLAFDVRHAFPAGWKVEGGVSRRGYDDKKVDEAGYGETRLHAGFGYDGPGPRFRAGVERRGRSYSGADPEERDYRVTTLRASGETAVGDGRLLASVARTSRDAETEGGDYTILRPDLVWRTSNAGSGAETRVSLERFRRSDDEDADQDRIRGHIRFHRTGARSRGYFGPEASIVSYPNRDEAGYGDYGFAGKSDRTAGPLGEGARGGRRWRLYYRRHEWEEEFDFVAFTWNSRRTPVRKGWIHEFGFTAKGFTEQADYDTLGDAGTNPSVEQVYTALGDVVNAFQTTREPHRADLYLLLGKRLRPSPIFLRSVDVSGSIGHSFFVDSERHRLQEKADDLTAELPDSLSGVTPLGETDFLFRNTVNQARWGIRAAAEVVPAPRATGRAAVRYDRGLYYNGDPMQTSSSLDVRIDGAYALRPDLSLELRYELHRARVGDAGSPQDFNRSEFALRCRYRFAGAIPLGGREGEIP